MEYLTGIYLRHRFDVKEIEYPIENHLDSAVVTSITEEGTKDLNGLILHFIPVACYAYTVGENTINQTKTIYGL